MNKIKTEYNIWIHIEKREFDGEGNENHEDEGIPARFGTYPTISEARSVFENLTGELP